MKVLPVLFLLFSIYFSNAQEKNYKITALGFYNVENLFDIYDDPEKNDEEFTPEGKRRWNASTYNSKLDNLADAISELGIEKTSDGLAILGLSEVENKAVIEDLVKHDKLKGRNYQIIHEDSPDRRGIDVALIYQENLFKPLNYHYYPLMIFRDDERIYTRDILYVSGELDDEIIHILVNHWPSRSGGEKRTRPSRNAAALKCKIISDSIRTHDPAAKIFIMGDLNDDPISPSLKKVLNAKRLPSQTPKDGFYNPMYELYKKGIGSNAYRDAWSLFDQIIISQPLLNKNQQGFFFYQVVIQNKTELVQKFGQYKGYPFRTFSGDTFINGYSDHFPVYLYLLKEID